MSMPAPKIEQTKLLKHLQTSELNICEVYYAANLRQPKHTHRFASFSFVLYGNYSETVSSRTYSRQNSTVVFHPPEESHAVVFENEVRILSVEVNFERLAQLQKYSMIFNDSTSHRSEEINLLGNKIYREFYRMDAFSMLAIEGLILELLAAASRCKIDAGEKKIPRWLDRTKEFLNENFAETATIEQLARLADVHPIYLSRVFREKFGCTIGEYVRRRRIEFAARQIAATETPLCQIAQDAGFADQSHLNKTFKSVFNLTPADYRRTFRKS